MRGREGGCIGGEIGRGRGEGGEGVRDENECVMYLR